MQFSCWEARSLRPSARVPCSSSKLCVLRDSHRERERDAASTITKRTTLSKREVQQLLPTWVRCSLPSPALPRLPSAILRWHSLAAHPLAWMPFLSPQETFTRPPSSLLPSKPLVNRPNPSSTPSSPLLTLLCNTADDSYRPVSLSQLPEV